MKLLEGLIQGNETQLDFCAREHPVGSRASAECICTVRTSIRGEWTPGPDWPVPRFKWLDPNLWEKYNG